MPCDRPSQPNPEDAAIGPIDVVYTWVDGNDPLYAAERGKFAVPGEHAHFDATHFRSNGELRYSLRSLLKHAGWVGKIFIVTNNQVPDFVNPDSARIEIVPIDRIIPHPGSLPNFNSMAIECCLHHIPGLADRFLYLNDDFFLGRPVTPAELSGSHGLGLFLMEPRPLAGAATELYQSYLRHTDLALSRVYGTHNRLNLCHVPQLFDRHVCRKITSLWPAEIAATISHRFRTPTDVMFRLLYAYTVLYDQFGAADAYDLASRHPTDLRLSGPHDYIWIPYGDPEHDVARMLERVKAERFMFFCLQDHMGGDLPHQIASLDDFMRGMFDTKT